VPTPAAALAAARRLVVKIGSALLVDEEGEIHRAWLDALVDDLARCRARNQDVIVVNHDAALAIKVSFPRPQSSGSKYDSDVYGGQQYAPLLSLTVPD